MSNEENAGSERQLEVAILLFNGLTALDFVGPHMIFASAGMKVHLVSATPEPIVSDNGTVIVPNATFDDCPTRLDILFVPGGFVGETMCDSATLAFLADRGAKASYVTSVCNGSLVLAAAGLLDGYRSATHWATRGHLAQLGVEVSTERVCIDRNRMSGGGVTAGIDFGLTIVAHVFGDDVAKFCQLAAEYDPKPPFDAGIPEKAGPETVATFDKIMGEADVELQRAVSHVLEQRAMVS
ncbi:DJ-1/PfpI family protein [Streptomyces sp. NPDC059455]|uniref:DJ-1/PfpI family protein n=1 Tax=Streptomyces sp. NPDC059455 TaxID=3346837 RepID=UPI0036CD7BB0